MRTAGSVETGRHPVRVAAAADGRTVWVGNDGDDTVVALDTRSLATVARFDVGPGHKELAFAEGGRTLVATAAGSPHAVLVDVAALARKGEVDVGRGVTALAAGDQAAVAANGAGELVLVSTRTLSAVARAAFAPRVAAVRFDPSGRWAFAAAPAVGRVAIVDASSGRLRHDLDGFAEPDGLAFTASYAYVHNARSTKVSLVRLDSLGKAAPPAVSDVEIAQQASGQDEASAGAPVIVPNPEGDSVTVAAAADQALYQYREGMMAPVGTHKNYGRRPQSAMVLDRSLAEVRPGVYATTVRVRDPGRFDVQFLSDRPRALACLEVAVAGSAPADRAPAALVELAPEFDPARHLVAGREAHLAFRASRRGGGALAGDATVLLVRMPGVWQWRGPARRLGPGRYEVAVAPPAPGQYKLLVAFEADGVPVGALDPITLGVEAAAPVALEGQR
jgi:hypothetical protein